MKKLEALENRLGVSLDRKDKPMENIDPKVLNDIPKQIGKNVVEKGRKTLNDEFRGRKIR